ncbi:hypothetical protein ACVWXO_004474 [Bradyrhizobium sp. LM2.7]
MATTETTKTGVALRGTMLGTVGHLLVSRQALPVIAILFAVALAVFAALNWSWLVAAVASILLSVLPCLVMCGLGLCMHKFVGRAAAPSASESLAIDGSDISTPAASGSLSGSAMGAAREAVRSRTRASRNRGRRSMRKSPGSAVLAIALTSVAGVAVAESDHLPRLHSGMMGSETGGMMRGMMGMMQSCGAMMRDGSRSGRPNEQWREDRRAAPDGGPMIGWMKKNSEEEQAMSWIDVVDSR